MDNKQYQRAVTPTIEGGTSAGVRGKILTYSNPATSVGTRGPSTMGRPPTNSTMSYRSTSTISPRVGAANGLAAADMSIQGKLAGNGASASSSAKMTYGSNQISSITDQLNSISVAPRYDLIPVYDDLPTDGVVFARVRNQPDNMVVFRTPDERLRNPERLNLDRRQLEHCPILEQEQRLRLLNYQNNMIKQISNLENLPNLIFLDLYNNQITSLDGPLSSVKGLRVLMAGKNKIQKICNLQALKKLDVLDLHSNEIKVIEGLDGLSDLRVLNLAGNRISIVNSLNSLTSLTELNLRRNKIQNVQGLDKLPALQRVFLSHNAIQSLQDVSCIFGIQYLIELSLDGNPVADADPTKYRQYIISTITTLKHLDLKRINDDERIAPFDSSLDIPKVVKSVDNFDKCEDEVESTIKAEGLGIECIDAGTDQDIVENPKISGEANFVPEEVCQDDMPATKQNIPQDSLNDDIENPTQPVAVQPPQQVSVHLQNNMATANPQMIGSSNAVEGIAVLARCGRLLKMQSLFDIEVLGPEEKVMVIVGESWDWNAPKRLISAVTEACLLHIRRECLLSKFNSTHLQSMSSLRTMRFLFNEFSSLRQVEFIPTIYGSNLHHLYIQENPINQNASSILRSYMIAMIPKLLSFNGVTISSLERIAAEKAYQPFLAIKSKNIKQFTSLSTKMSKQFTSDTGGNEISSPQSKKNQATVHNHIQLYNDLYKHQNQRLDLDDYTQEFNYVIKDIISNVISGMRQHGQHH